MIRTKFNLQIIKVYLAFGLPLDLKTFKTTHHILPFLIIAPFEGLLYLNKYDSPSPDDALCQDWI